MPLLLQCSKTENEKGSFPAFGETTQYPSPFEHQKVLLPAESFDSATAIKKITKENLEMVVVVDNQCAEVQCNREEAPKDWLSCQLYKSEQMRAELPVQFYPYKPQVGVDYDSLVYWINRDSCAVGLTQAESYETSSFNDPLYNNKQRPYLDTIRFSQFNIPNLAPVKVAIVDSGVGIHPDLGGSQATPGVLARNDMRSVASIEAVGCPTNYTDQYPLNTHGTFVAGIIAGTQNNELGMTGIAPNAQILSYTVGNCFGQMSTTEIANALMAAAIDGAEVVNLSLGGAPRDDPALRAAIVTLLNRNAVIVVSAGNSYKDLDVSYSYPASYGEEFLGFIPVAWGTQNGKLFQGNGLNQGSNYSPRHIKVLAPGTNIYSTMNPTTSPGYADISDDLGRGSGSSFSAPIVTGAAALAIGFFKSREFSYTKEFVEDLLTNEAAIFDTELEEVVRNGAVLDFKKLSDKLLYIEQIGSIPQPITTSNEYIAYDSRAKAPYIEFDANWDLAVTPAGSRIGVFDEKCGIDLACLIQDFEFEENTGSRRFRITRNEALPTLPFLSDPEFGLKLKVAIYSKVFDNQGKVKKLKTVASKTIDLRDYDLNIPNAPLLGKVTSVRRDMRHFYIKGWACVEGDNAAVPVQIIDEDGNPVVADYLYYYPLMFPHPFVADKSFAPRQTNYFVASSTRMMFYNVTSAKSGTEGSPIILPDCRTMTPQHAFEFAIPITEIARLNLSGKKLSIKATHTKQASVTRILPDIFDKEQILVPDFNFQPDIGANVTLNRTNGDINISGTVCSNSPNPIHIEVSYAPWNMRCRLGKFQNFPNFSEGCPLQFGIVFPPDFVHDPVIGDDIDKGSWYYWDHTATPPPTRVEFPVDYSDAMRALIETGYPNFKPNSIVNLGYSMNTSQQFIDFLKLKGVAEAGTGHKLENIVIDSIPIDTYGSKMVDNVNRFLADRAAVSVGPAVPRLAPAWDWMDVGEVYTDALVAYSINEESPVGRFLKDNFKVKKLMRETKKYETALSQYSVVLGHNVIQKPSATPACGYQFAVSKSITDMLEQRPRIYSYVRAFLKQGENPLDHIPVDPTDITMQEIPLDIRVFQDGVMTLHLLSDYGSNTVRIETLGRGKE